MAGRQKSRKKNKSTTRARKNITPVVDEHVEEHVEEYVEELSGENLSDDLSASSEESQPLPPSNLYFKNTEFTKTSMIQSKCSVTKTVDVIKNLKNELPWFKRHPQFSHFFHMPQEDNLKLLVRRRRGHSLVCS
ncbi:hypothetical protein Bca52824_010999 [Brassica carinata]|uniref:Uncharacterized protein n=1 Tax=Brassica carinata TaxID=52824 RepID=A0A8X7WEW9_BRACI|nr:hypothetical protein Bca52824_010999 [Brassica carinata]